MIFDEAPTAQLPPHQMRSEVHFVHRFATASVLHRTNRQNNFLIIKVFKMS